MRHAAIVLVIGMCVSIISILGCARRPAGSEGPYGHERHYMETEPGVLDPSYIAAEFPGKIVYTNERDVDMRALRRDCTRRGGYFNECGSPCAEGATCAEVCAYTCEFR